MKQLLNMFSGIAGLAVAGFLGLALFTVVGGLVIAAGIAVTTLLVGGGIYAMVTGRRLYSVRQGDFSGVRVFDLRTGRPFGEPRENEMIDITPPKPSKGKR